MTIRFHPIPTDLVRALQAGAPDANGQPPGRHVAEGSGNPCRHCLAMIPEGAAKLVLAHRPFPAPQPHAEVGPIFLCADPCRAGGVAALPATLASPDYIVRGVFGGRQDRPSQRRRGGDRRYPGAGRGAAGRRARGLMCKCGRRGKTFQARVERA